MEFMLLVKVSRSLSPKLACSILLTLATSMEPVPFQIEPPRNVEPMVSLLELPRS
jgi:hypothetical protein